MKLPPEPLGLIIITFFWLVPPEVGPMELAVPG